ncbi:unnamed protein product [Spodoptera exigua]|nr:unnamed protein product [Spodoptera exigua]
MVGLATCKTCGNVSGEGQEHGPVFLMEPPPRLVFSNTTGARASCAAHGFPSPQIAWQQPDGQQLDDVPGLRFIVVQQPNPYDTQYVRRNKMLPFPTPDTSRGFIQYQEARQYSRKCGRAMLRHEWAGSLGVITPIYHGLPRLLEARSFPPTDIRGRSEFIP